MKEKKTSGDVGRIYRVGGAAGKAGNCENPENTKVQEYTCAGRETGRCTEWLRKKRGESCQ